MLKFFVSSLSSFLKMATLSKQKIRVARLLEHQTLAVHSLYYEGKRYSKVELENILEAYYRRQNRNS
jgi:hypothetical protein